MKCAPEFHTGIDFYDLKMSLFFLNHTLSIHIVTNIKLPTGISFFSLNGMDDDVIKFFLFLLIYGMLRQASCKTV